MRAVEEAVLVCGHGDGCLFLHAVRLLRRRRRRRRRSSLVPVKWLRFHSSSHREIDSAFTVRFCRVDGVPCPQQPWQGASSTSSHVHRLQLALYAEPPPPGPAPSPCLLPPPAPPPRLVPSSPPTLLLSPLLTPPSRPVPSPFPPVSPAQTRYLSSPPFHSVFSLSALSQEKERLRKQMEARLTTMRAGLKRRLQEARAERAGTAPTAAPGSRATSAASKSGSPQQ